MLDYLQGIARNWPPAGASLLLALAVGGLLWLTHNALTRFDDRRVLFSDGNVAYTVQRVALVLAFGVAALPTLTRAADEDPWYSLVGQAMELGWVFVALLGVRYLVDVVVLARVDNTAELLRGNVAIGVVEAGFYLAFGWILNGSLTGAAPSLAAGLASTVVFGMAGLLVVVAVFWLHELVTPWHLRQHLREGRPAAAFEAAGVLTATGIVVREGVAGDFASWTGDLTAFGGTVVFAVATLYLFRWLANRMLLRTLTLREIQEGDRVTAAAFSAAVMVVVALSVAAVVRTQL